MCGTLGAILCLENNKRMHFFGWNAVIGTRTHLFNHLCELLVLVFNEFLVVLSIRNVQLVSRLGLGRLEGTRQDGDFGIFHQLQTSLTTHDS